MSTLESDEVFAARRPSTHTLSASGLVAGYGAVTALDGASKVSATTLAAAPVQAVTLGTGGATLQLGAAGSTTMDKVRAIL